MSTATDATAIYELLEALPPDVGVDLEDLANATGIPAQRISWALSWIRHHPGEKFPVPYVVQRRKKGPPIYFLLESEAEARDYLEFRAVHECSRLRGSRIFWKQVQEQDVNGWTRRKARVIERLLTTAEHHIDEVIAHTRAA
jgi:hypothetical protein